jgi:aspartyl-tRNA(Asn)/glutamyl-tRNA(Gln) amidotransferase subunit A
MTMAADLRSVESVGALVRTGALSPVDLVQTCLERIDARRELNAFITVRGEAAVEEARTAEREIAGGHYRGPLHGIPVSVKDLVDVAGTPTTSGSAVPPRTGVGDAPIVTRLREAGAILIGKTNLHEFAFGTTSDETAFGAVHHPRHPSRSAGGSSAGAAVGLVEGMCFASVGTDTGGSIRIPSAVCGTVGLKPTWGELPCEGVVPLSTTLDHVGPMGRTVADTRLLFAAMKGRASEPREARGRLRFAVPEAYFCDRLEPAVRDALSRARQSLRAAGHEVETVTIDRAAWTPDVYLHIVLPEASWYHAEMVETHPGSYSPGVRLRLEMGRYILAEDYVRALHLRELLRGEVDRAMEGYDALLLPTLPIPAPPLGAASVSVDGVQLPVRAVMLKLTQLFNVTGHPAIALPAGTTADGWPVSLQLVGHRQHTDDLLAVAAAIEPQLGGATRAGDAR